MTNRCDNPDCNHPFGLIRFSWRFGQFCSSKCRESYKRQRDRNKVYWKWLYNCSEPSTADQNSPAMLPLPTDKQSFVWRSSRLNR